MTFVRASIVGSNIAAVAIAIAIAGGAEPARADQQALTQKINAYIGCINRLSERAFESRARYLSWVGKNGPTGKERIIYGTYTIYDTTDCRKKVDEANAIEPHDADLESAAAAYAEMVATLEPLLREADDYYTQQNYKDDKMAKGKALHPRLLAAWKSFAAADQRLRGGIEAQQDRRALENLAQIEASEGRKGRYHIEALMIRAKHISRTLDGGRDLAAISASLAEYEAIVRATEAYASADKESGIGSGFVGAAKSVLTTAKQLMRRIRDKVPYSSGDRMMLSAGGGWMVEGSPARFTRDYNQLVDSYNRGAKF